jgi:hypothetical protein
MVLETRTLQGEGIFIIPEIAKKSRLAIIQLSVLQEPSNRSQNKKIQPFRTFYGWMTIMANNRVVRQHEILFPYEEPLRYEGEHAYLLTYLHCAVRNVNDNLIELHGGVPIEAYKPTWYQWFIDELRFVLYSDTILKVDLIYETIPAICETINPAEQAMADPGSQNPGGNNGDPGDPNPNSTPNNPNPGNIPISPPYDPNSNDNGHSGTGIPANTQTVLITMYGPCNNQYNQIVPIDTRNYPSQYAFAPYANRPFSLNKVYTFRDDLAEWDVVDKFGNHYGCGEYAWKGTPNFRVEPWSQ